MTLRTLGSSLSADSDIKASLLKNDAFVYAHLVKIEKAVKTVTGDNSRKASDYAYITDSGFDIDFDDGSTDGSGAANGSRTYFANKLISTGSISETIEARASSISIQLSAAALNTETNIDFTTTSSSTYYFFCGCSSSFFLYSSSFFSKSVVLASRDLSVSMSRLKFLLTGGCGT